MSCTKPRTLCMFWNRDRWASVPAGLCASPTFPLELGNPYPYSHFDGHFKGTRAQGTTI